MFYEELKHAFLIFYEIALNNFLLFFLGKSSLHFLGQNQLN